MLSWAIFSPMPKPFWPPGWRASPSRTSPTRPSPILFTPLLEHITMNDVIIIGGSFAGLAAALNLGRARRKVTILDTGNPRNRYASNAHGLLGHDGKPPSEILADARQ